MSRPQPLVDDTFAVAERFFARAETDKLALKVGKYDIGCPPARGTTYNQAQPSGTRIQVHAYPDGN